MVTTSNPSIAACSAQIGSTSVTSTRAPPLRSEAAEPLPTSPKPATHATSPASITSVARRIASTRLSLQPYRLSNFDLVTLSLTFIAGNGTYPFLAMSQTTWTRVRVSSQPPLSALTFQVSNAG